MTYSRPIKEFAKSIYGQEPQSMDELGHAVIKIIDTRRPHMHWGYAGGRRDIIKIKCVGLAWDVKHVESVSNTHSSPEGYPTNWGSQPGVAKGYPGWTGRVWVRYSNDNTTFGSDGFDRTLTHTGTGGAGSYDGPWKEVGKEHFNRYGSRPDPKAYPKICSFSWDFRIYDYDWPEIDALIHHKNEVKKWEQTVLRNWKRAVRQWEKKVELWRVTDLVKHEEQAMLAKLEDRWIRPIYPPTKPSRPDPPPHPSHKFFWECPNTKKQDDLFLAGKWKPKTP